MELKDTIDGMLSDDEIERFKAEYMQLCARIDRLYKYMCENTISSKEVLPLCEQAQAMVAYKKSLERRAKIHKIKLERRSK